MEALNRITKDRNHLDREIKEHKREMNQLYTRILQHWKDIETKTELSDQYTNIIERMSEL